MSADDVGEDRAHVGRLRPGVVVRHRDGGVDVLARRKENETGWWCLGGGGLADDVLASGQWFYVADSLDDLVTRFDRAVLADIEARNPGIDPVDVQTHRDRAAVIGGQT